VTVTAKLGQACLPLPANLDDIVERNLVYALVDPRTAEVRYVGKTIRGVERIREHTQSSSLDREETYKARWIRSLRRDGLAPVIRILEAQPTRKQLNEAEVRWIAYGRESGWPLTNLTDGGEGALGRNPESIAKFRAKMIGHPVSAETRAKISAANKIAYASPKLRKLVGDRARGKELSPEARALISAAGVRRFEDPVARARQGEAQRRRFAAAPVSEETRARLSAAGRGRVFTEETRRKMKAAWVLRRSK